MLGVVNCALIVLSVGYFTLALPLEKNQRNTEPVIEVIEQGAPCGAGAKVDDDVKATVMSYFKGVGDKVERGPKMTTHFIVGESHIPGMDEGLVGMCPGDIHRVHSPSVGGINGRQFTDYFDIELVSIGDSERSMPPEMDTNGDNVLDRQELANYMATILDQEVPVERIQELFDEMDKNWDGVIDFNEMQAKR